MDKLSSKVKKPKLKKSMVKSIFPILDWLPKYDIKKQLMGDVIAGVTIAIMQVIPVIVAFHTNNDFYFSLY